MLKNSSIRHSSHPLSSVQPAPRFAHPSRWRRRWEITLSGVSQSIWTTDGRSSMLLGDRRNIATVLAKSCSKVSRGKTTGGGRSDEVMARHIFRVAPKLFHVTLSPLTPQSLSLAFWHVNYGRTQINEAGDIILLHKAISPTHTHICVCRRKT